MVNFNIKKFCSGAKDFLSEIEHGKKFDYFFLPIFNLIKLYEKGVNMSIIMPYSDSLQNLSFGTDNCGQKVLVRMVRE